MEQILESIYQTLDTIEVKGQSNIEKMYMSMIAIKNLIADVKLATADIKKEDGEING